MFCNVVFGNSDNPSDVGGANTFADNDSLCAADSVHLDFYFDSSGESSTSSVLALDFVEKMMLLSNRRRRRRVVDVVVESSTSSPSRRRRRRAVDVVVESSTSS